MDGWISVSGKNHSRVGTKETGNRKGKSLPPPNKIFWKLNVHEYYFVAHTKKRTKNRKSLGEKAFSKKERGVFQFWFF